MNAYKAIAALSVFFLVTVLFAGTVTIPASAQATPNFGPLSPAFIKYQQDLAAGNVSKGVRGQAGSGIIPAPVDLSQLKGQALTRTLVGYPLTYDLRTQNKLTSVKDQGSCGSCWAFGAYASLESYLRPAETLDFSENNMKNTHGFDPAPCGGGNQFMSTAYLARWSGPVNETDDPYNPSSGSSPANLPIQKHVQDVYFIPDRAGATDNNNIKMAVSTYGAVYTQMYMNAASPYYNATSFAYYYGHSTGVNHGVAIVGWDDNFNKTKFISGNQPPGDGAFIVKNSWGTGWGEQGYFYVSYYDAIIGKDNAAFTAQPTTNYNNIYQYDPLGYTSDFGEGSTSEWGANVFTANSSEDLSAVSFYTHSLSAPYEVYVYTDPTSGPINASGYVAHVTGALDFPGYHTIPLASSVSLRPGEKFSVVVKFTSADNYPVPVEAPVSGYSSQVRANAGESYYHADDGSLPPGSTWADMTSYSATSNICIKAFTKNVSGPLSTTTTLTTNNANPAVNQQFTLSGTLKAGTTPLSGKTLTLWRYDPAGTWTAFPTTTTDANGAYTFTRTESSSGSYYYQVIFSGDTAYSKSWTDLRLPVGTLQPTTTTLTTNNANPAVNQQFTLNGTLKAGTTPLSGKTLTLWRYDPAGTWTAFPTTTTDANGAYTFTRSESSPGSYYYQVIFSGDTAYSKSWTDLRLPIGSL
jgi:C1A family cysteine protease